jgi:hypothetical protein
MPFRVLLSPPDGLGVVELSGDVAWPELAAAIRALYGHPWWEPGFYTLWQGGGITSLVILPTDFPDVRRTFEEVAPARQGGRTAIVAREQDEPLWALFPRLGPPTSRPLAIVRSKAEALAFLGRGEVLEGMEVVAGS